MKENMQDQLVTVKEMAKILKVPVGWLYQRTMLGQKAIPHLKFGKYVRFNPSAVIAHFAQRQKDSE